MTRDVKIFFGIAFILLLLVGLFYQTKPEEKAGTASSSLLDALVASGINAQWVTVTESAEVEEAFGVELGEGDAAVIIFDSAYDSLGEGAAKEYVVAIISAFDANKNITYAVALAPNIIGSASKRPILAWADRNLAEELSQQDAFSAYNKLNLRNLEIEEGTGA